MIQVSWMERHEIKAALRPTQYGVVGAAGLFVGEFQLGVMER